MDGEIISCLSGEEFLKSKWIGWKAWDLVPRVKATGRVFAVVVRIGFLTSGDQEAREDVEMDPEAARRAQGEKTWRLVLGEVARGLHPDVRV